jgi:predicted metal-dependent hydrolase
MSGIDYKVIFSRRHTISICINPDKGVIVRAPYRASIRTIEQFVMKKSDWIKKHIDNYSELRRLNKDKKYTDGEYFLFMGKENILKINYSPKSYVNHNDNTIEVGTPDKESGKVKVLLEKWYSQKAREVFSGRMEEILKKYRDYYFAPRKLIVKTLKSRWGSCTSKGKITLSSELIKLDEIYIEYVIIHELCHLKFHNHGKEFYKLLGELIPAYKTIRKELRKYFTG